MILNINIHLYAIVNVQCFDIKAKIKLAWVWTVNNNIGFFANKNVGILANSNADFLANNDADFLANALKTSNKDVSISPENVTIWIENVTNEVDFDT